MPWLAFILPLCLFAIIITINVYVNSEPNYDYICTACQGHTVSDFCTCPTEADICLWGVFMKIGWETVYAYVALFILSLYAFALMVRKGIEYAEASRQSREFQSKIADALCVNRAEEAKGIASLYPKSPLAVVVWASLQNSETASGVWGINPLMHARHRAIVAKTEDLRRGLWLLAALGWTAPLVALFIFLAGVIVTLDWMKYAEGTGISAIAGSVSESLWAAVFSILVAVPIIWSHKYLSAKAETFILEMDRLSLAILEQITSHQRKLLAELPKSHYVTQELNACPTRRMTD